MLMFPQMPSASTTPDKDFWSIYRAVNYPAPQIKFVDFFGCSPSQQKIIQQDRIEAEFLALSGLDPADSKLMAKRRNAALYVKAGGTFMIDWTTDAVREHWGSLSWDPDARAHRTRIIETLWKAAGIYPNASSGYPSEMYRVSITCPGSFPHDEEFHLCQHAHAFAYQGDTPVLNFCPDYFKRLYVREAAAALKKFPGLKSSLTVLRLSRMWVMYNPLHR
ncbi:hypothetical protein PMIN02_007596 [Paraphaeosphaeria minitans]